MSFNQIPEIRIGDFPIFPYNNLEEACKDIDFSQKHFEEKFRVRIFREGYILASQNIILDSKGYAVSKTNPLEGALESFNKIVAESKEHSY